MSKEYKHLFGPVPSRRLGLSLGVDIVPFKVCTFDCVYCQVGRTTDKTVERKEYVPVDEVISELKNKVAEGLKADYITLSGSGEPTLNSSLGELIDKIKKVTDIPVAVITNGSLLYDPEVRDQCCKADLVLPSLDAADAEGFEKVNRPADGITIEKVIDGLVDFSKMYSGQIWLEVFIVVSANTNDEQIKFLKNAIEKINPNKIQINTAVRPTADMDVKRADYQLLQNIADIFGPRAEIIADYSAERIKTAVTDNPDNAREMETLLSMLKRRPCSLEDICASLGMVRNQAVKYITILQQKGQIEPQDRQGVIYYKAT